MCLDERMEPQTAATSKMSAYQTACAICRTNINRKSGYPIVNMGYDTKTPKYCCGSVVDNQCKDGDPFTIGNGAVIPEVAALAGYVKASAITDTTCSNSLSITTSSNSASTAITACPTSTGDNTSPSSHDLAIGVGVGVPLGVIALASIVWALWERRQTKHARLEESMPAT
ncbi:conserved hypothetical protein [Aspergillus fumigatus Af293]|uniref:Uncharacterized protein n=2 Tax=Aspergillus fumigatus TaxID=746128 RepID=A4D9E1_ASPFU|nr:conserved hypothetical protein [Aspergillus fumigatus Af293]EBA27450.1 conserved hypothetical protein [Aspergillus fumigatus Af293]